MRVEPGEYTVKVIAGKNEKSTKVIVEEDPRVTISTEDRIARRQALSQLAQMAGSAAAARRTITGLRTAVNTYVESWKTTATKPPENVQKAAQDLLKKADDTCKKIATLQQCGERALGVGNAGPPLTYTPPPISQRVTQLLGSLENFVAPPTTWQLDQIKLLDGMLKESAGATRKLVSDDLASLNKMMNESGVPHIVVPNTGRGTSATASNEEEEP